MTPNRSALVCAVLLLLVSAARAEPPTRGPAAGDPAAGGELREAMRRYFTSRLRAELSLSDEQVAHIGPRVERLERARADARRERVRLVFELRRGLEAGDTDTELQRGLERLELLDVEQRDLERKTLREVDEVLSVRQRVQLRFFIQQFREDLQQRVNRLRGDRPRPRERRRPGREGP